MLGQLVYVDFEQFSYHNELLKSNANFGSTCALERNIMRMCVCMCGRERERERGPFHSLCLELEQPLIMHHSFFFGNQPWIPLLPQLVLR